MKIDAFELPTHNCGLTISHNEYKNYYDHIEMAVYNLDDYWCSEEERKKALETGEIWEIQWYPYTPGGFNRIAASTLSAAINAANNL